MSDFLIYVFLIRFEEEVGSRVGGDLTVKIEVLAMTCDWNWTIEVGVEMIGHNFTIEPQTQAGGDYSYHQDEHYQSYDYPHYSQVGVTFCAGWSALPATIA